MNARAFQQWMGRIGLAAALLLLAVPTTGRFVHAGMAGAQASVMAKGAGHHAHHASDAHEGARSGGRQAPRPAPGDSDCDYCPLLASLIGPYAALHVAADPPPVPAALVAGDAPRLAWLHPTGLGSRGPPLHG